MKSIGAISLIMLYVFALCKPLVPLIDYVSNFEYYSTILCENKDRPELACKGRCVFMQKMTEKAQEENPLNNITIYAEEEIPENLQEFPIFSSLVSASLFSYPSDQFRISGPILDPLFPPPQA